MITPQKPIGKSIEALEKQGKYVWRYRHIGFNEGINPAAPQREGDITDKWDVVFDSKQEFDQWFRETSVGLAELDQVMNFCQYFVREKGNKGKYERESKSHEVDGTWDGYHIEGSALFPFLGYDYKLMDSFKAFLKENGWEKGWFRLHERYES